MKRWLSLLLSFLTLSAPVHAEESQVLTLFAVNVGKGDALLLNAGEHTYLIDTGKVEHWGDLSRALTLLQVTHLTGVIATHTDKDHVGGALPLAMSPIRVDAWYASRYFADVKESKHPMVTAAALRGETVQWLGAGDTLPLGSGKLTVIGPMSPSDTENCNSLVMIAEGGGGRMLLTGDMEFDEEIELMNAGLIPRCEVLKVGNHGEIDATSEALVRFVQPRIALISTSTEEEPDTPDLRVLRALMKFGANVVQTQQAETGVLVTLQDGIPEAQLMGPGELPEMVGGVILAERDAEDDSIQLRNDGEKAADISGWYIVSQRGGELFVLPGDTMLQPGQTLCISTLSSDEPGDLVWPEKKVWHKSKDDAALLYDVYGRLIDHLE